MHIFRKFQNSCSNFKNVLTHFDLFFCFHGCHCIIFVTDDSQHYKNVAFSSGKDQLKLANVSNFSAQVRGIMGRVPSKLISLASVICLYYPKIVTTLSLMYLSWYASSKPPTDGFKNGLRVEKVDQRKDIVSSEESITGDVVIDSENLKSLSMPNLTNIAGDLRIHADNLETIDLRSLTTIGGKFELHCNNIRQLVIPGNPHRDISIQLFASWAKHAPEVLHENLGISVRTISLTYKSNTGPRYAFWQKEESSGRKTAHSDASSSEDDASGSSSTSTLEQDKETFKRIVMNEVNPRLHDAVRLLEKYNTDRKSMETILEHIQFHKVYPGPHGMDVIRNTGKRSDTVTYNSIS